MYVRKSCGDPYKEMGMKECELDRMKRMVERLKCVLERDGGMQLMWWVWQWWVWRAPRCGLSLAKRWKNKLEVRRRGGGGGR